MNADLTGTVRIMGEADSIPVDIYVADEELRLVSQQGELGRWRLSDIGIAAKLDGFHLRVEGEELIVSTSDDAVFGLALGIRSSSSPRLSRLLAGARDKGLEWSEPSVPSPTAPRSDALGLDSSPLDQLAPVIAGLWASAAAQALAAIIVLASDSPIRLVGFPAWPAWIAAAVAVGAGALALRNGHPNGRRLVAAGVIVGVLTVAISLGRIGEATFSWITDGIVFGGSGTLLAGLLLAMEGLNRGR